MRSLYRILYLIIILSSAAFAQSGGKITGTVRLGDEDTVLHQVSIRIAELKLRTTTDTNGNYQFIDVPAGTYTITAHQDGFTDATQKVTVTAGADTSADFRLQIAGVKENVTVTASGSEESSFESIAPVAIMDSSQITSRAAVGLGDVLQDQSGVTKRSASPGSSRPVIRGFDGDRVLVSNDGVSVGSLASQSGDHAEPVDTLAAERIEVVKGPATLLYGSSAIGGVVNTISGHDEGAHPGFRGYLSGLGGTNNGQAAGSGGGEFGTGKWMFWGSGSAQRAGEYRAGGDFGTVRNTFANYQTGSAGFGYFAKHAFFNTNFTYYQNRYGIPLDFREPDPETRSLRMHRGDLKFNLGFTETPGFVNSVKLTVDLSRYQHQELEQSAVGTTFRNNVNSYRAMFEQKPYGRLTGRFGFEGFRRNFSTIGDEELIDGPVRQDAFSVFGLEEVKFERASLQFGARGEHNSYAPENAGLTPRSFNGLSAAAGARFDLWQGGAFVANFTHGYRAAAIEELYNHGPHDGTLLFEVGSSDLKPEISNGVDLSLRQQNSRVKAEVNFFYYGFKDFIFLAPTDEIDPDSGFFIADYLQGDSRFTGAEFSLDLKAHKYLNILSGVDYVNAQLRDGRPLPRIAPLRARFGLDIHKNAFSLRPELVAVDRQERVFALETPTAGYGTANLTATYVLSRKHTAHIFSVNASNLNDKLYYNHISFIKDISPEMGRSVRATYTVRFF